MRTRILITTCLLLASAMAWAGDGYDNYINYLQGQDWPNEHTPFYAEDVQGITHDDDHWYVSKQGAHGTRLYKVHVSQDMASGNYSAVTSPLLSGTIVFGFDEFKAMDAHVNPFDGKWYIVMAVQGSSGAGFAVFRTDLTLVGTSSASPQSGIGWCAIDNDGRIYSGENNTSHLNRFTLDWQALANSGTVNISFLNTVQLTSGGSPLTMDQYQGGDFTPEGDKLYIVTGFFGVPTANHGIHVFDATQSSSFSRVDKSGQSGMFAYQYNPTCEFGDYTCEEPEGLTFWDLNQGQSPNIRGELHVLLLDNDQPDGDDVYLKHYSEGIWVDSNWPVALPSNGDPATPETTVAAGLARHVPGLELKLRAGNYAEILTISQAVKIVCPSSNGDAIIGK